MPCAILAAYDMSLLARSHVLWDVLSMTEAILNLTFVCLSNKTWAKHKFSQTQSLNARYSIKLHLISIVCSVNRKELREKMICDMSQELLYVSQGNWG